MTHRSRFVGAALVLQALSTPLTAAADDGAAHAKVHDAADHFERGVTLYEEHDFRAALIEFERAYSIAPHYAVLYNVGQCRYQLEDYAGSLAAFEKYLATGGTQGPADQRRRVEATVDDLRKRVARVLVTTDVDGAEISVDDVVVGTTPLASPLVVSEGRRKIGASKAGYATASRTVDVAGSDSTEAKLYLEPTTPPVAPPRPLPATWVVVPPAHAASRSVAPILAMFGLAAGGIGVGAVFGVLAVGNKNDLDLACQNRGCPPSSEAEIAALKRNAVISTVGFSIGTAGLVAGAAYLLLTPGRTETGRVHPFIGPGYAGATGSFQ